MNNALTGVYIGVVLFALAAVWLGVEGWLSHRKGEPK